MGTLRTRLLMAAVAGLLVLLGARAAETPTKAQGYYKALFSKISLQLAKAKDGGTPTIELAVAWVCKKAEVPYQVKRSRELGGDKVTGRVPPINYTNVVAGQAIVALAAQGGLVMMIDEEGVYLMPQPDAPAAVPPATRALSLNERHQLGLALQVNVTAIHGKDIDREYWREKDVEQQTQLRIKLTSTVALRDLKIAPRIYARIQRHSRGSSTYDDDKRPRYGSNKDFVEILSETITVAELPRLQAREIKSKAASTEYEVYDRWHGANRRYGEKYYGYVVDIYIGNQLIKSVTSTVKLYEVLGRDPRTGFPLR
ncbi:MAG: hypothetical protein JW889_16255 [Verrucomicrobia bacterium]|nr:hypothetical protein [Verrucomicrobiota bacterium]